MKLITIIITLFLLKLWFTRPININGLTLIFANKRTGKTTYLAKLAHDEMKRKMSRFRKPIYKEVLSTAPIYGTKKLDIKKDFGRKNIIDSLILDDESHENFSNRKTLPEHVIQYLRYQGHFKSTHKTRNDIVLISHSYEDLNINCRRVYDNMYIMDRSIVLSFITRKHITRIRKIKKFIDIDPMTQKPTDFYEYVFFLWGTTYFNRKPYYQYFDSLWRYDLPDEQFKEWETDCVINPTRLEKLILKFTKQQQPEETTIADS